MRTCLLLSGQIRNLKKTFESIKKNLIDVYNTDVFISTWVNGEGDDSRIDEVIEIYNPISIEVTTPNNILKNTIEPLIRPYKFNLPIETNPTSIFMMWYKIMIANELRNIYQKTNKFKYDVVIRSRFDLSCDSEIQLIRPSDNEIYIPRGYDWRGGYNDLFAIGTSETMNTYCGMFNNILPILAMGNLFHSESLLKTHLTMNRLNVKRIKMEMSLRGDKIYLKSPLY